MQKTEGTTMNETVAFDFLLYSYFKVSTSSTDEEVFDAAIQRAYNDAVGQGAFNTTVSKESKELLPQIKQAAFLRMQQIMKSHLQRDKFEGDWHRAWCKEIVDIYAPIKSHKGAVAFTYGNAQKWVNMTLKNLYILSIAFRSSAQQQKSWNQVVLNHAERFHIPLDNYILKAAFSEFDAMQGRIKEYGKKNLEYRIIADGKAYCWSNVTTYEMYFDFQNALMTSIKEKYAQSPLDWECKAWIAVAQNRSK